MNVIKKNLKLLLMHFFSMTKPLSKKSVYFDSFRGQFSDSPRAISDALHKADPSIEIVWLAKKKSEFPDYVKTVKDGSLGMIKAMAQASAWVMHGGGNKKDGVWKHKKIYSVATWHGDRGFKKIGFAAAKEMGKDYHLSAKLPDYSNVNIFTAASNYGVMQAREGLGYCGEILLEGLPRNDKLCFADKYKAYADGIKQKYGVPLDCKILLFAPTFRDHGLDKQKNIVDLNSVIGALESEYQKPWICLVRSHSKTKNIEITENEKILNVSHIGDMADLLLIADCLITDYSSCAGDFVLTKRPCILAQFDRSEYESQSRTLWVNPDESGFLIAKNQRELNDILNNINKYDHAAIAERVLKFYGTHETGTASDAVVKRILSWIYDGKK